MSENKTGRYFKYAIGEIILVVIGILIALQINNWNEKRKSISKENDMLSKLVLNLKIDSTYFYDQAEEIKTINDVYNELYEIGVKGKIVDSVADRNDVRRLLRYHPITKENDPFLANKISNETIRESVLTYFRMLTDLDVSYSEFADVIRNRMRLHLSKNNIHDLAFQFEKDHSDYFIKNHELIELAKENDFQQILFEASLKLEGVASELETLKEQNEILKTIIIKTMNE